MWNLRKTEKTNKQTNKTSLQIQRTNQWLPEVEDGGVYEIDKEETPCHIFESCEEHKSFQYKKKQFCNYIW